MALYNRNLITLKCVLFLFFGAIGSLYPFFPIHMRYIQLSFEDAINISWIAPLVATLGPLIACPLADYWATFSKTGRGLYLRIMIVLCFLFSIIFYWSLYSVPVIYRSPLKVTFMCDQEGGFIYQERCGKERTCYDFKESKRGGILVTNCIFACNESTPLPQRLPVKMNKEPSNPSLVEVDSYNPSNIVEPDYVDEDIGDGGGNDQAAQGIVPLPHMCFLNASGDQICEVYTNNDRPIEFNLALQHNVNNNLSGLCAYPFVDKFHCRVTRDLVPGIQPNDLCHPMVLCEVQDPYENHHSLLRSSQCGFDNNSYWFYVFLRPIGDIFIAAAVALLAAAIVIATRDTSEGRGDVGKQFLFGAMGFAIFPPIIGGPGNGEFLPAMISFTVLLLVACLILIFDGSMPLSPPEWWWHTKCGLLALPMSSVRKYGFEIGALGFILFILGVFWSSIDVFLPWHVDNMETGTPLITGLTLTVGSIPAMVYLGFAERFVDYCGHSNVLIYCFANYIIHHIALIVIEKAEMLLVCELLEIFTLHIMYVTAVMYMRHLVPRKYTACAQALPIVAHFCLGRCIGAVIGSRAYYEYPGKFNLVHMWMAVAAAIVGCLYFILYHFVLQPLCVAAAQVPPCPAPPLNQNGSNGTSSYSPLRVYHHEKAKKGHFRY